MTNVQRIILAVYLLAVAAACAWVPWKVSGPWYTPRDSEYHSGPYQYQMAQLRSGPVWSGPVAYPTDDDAYKLARRLAVPDYRKVVLRLTGLSAGFGALFVIAPLVWRNPRRLQ